MRRSELDYILSTMLGLDRQTDTVMRRRTEVSDLNFTVDRPLQVEQNGELVPGGLQSGPGSSDALPNGDDRPEPDQRQSAADRRFDPHRLLRRLLQLGRHGCAFASTSSASAADYSIVMRKLNTEIPSLAQLKLPEIFRTLPKEKTGLVLVTGATGSGKSTTLAAILNEINTHQIRPHHHLGRPGGVRPSAQEFHLQPAGNGQ